LDGVELVGLPAKALNRVRATRIAMVFQDSQQALNPYLSIGEQLTCVLKGHRLARGAAAAAKARQLLHRVGLPDADRQYRSYPHQLSGGMRQRAMIALALSCGPGMIIADEPTTALDVTVQAQILALLQELRREAGIGVLLITHDLGVVAQNCDRMLVMHAGRVVEQGSTAQVFDRPQRVETRAMLAAVPRLDALPPPRPAESPAVLRVENLTVSFRDRHARHAPAAAVRDLSFSLQRGETLAIVGESGSGKTTVARAVLGLIAADSGAIYLAGKRAAANLHLRPAAQRHAMQLVFQDPVASLNPSMTVESTLAEAFALRTPRLAPPARRKKVIAALARVGLDEAVLCRRPHELSGGQAQRVAIARALAFEPGILFCDEAVAAMDGTVRAGVINLIQAEQGRTGLSVVFITHDLAVVRQISHRVLVMYKGRLCELAGNDALFRKPQHPYTRLLLDSVPSADPRRRPQCVSAIGEIPSADASAAGCVFHPRCGFAVPACAADVPHARLLDGSAVACHRAEDIDLT
ncbi:MAG: ABC transporter ATP-binding protein, partial [Woeseia sp.]